MRIVFITVLLIFIAGSAIGGTAQSMTTLIVGRIIMGVGGSLVQQSCYSYIAVFARPAEMTRIYGQIGGIWALGLILGGPIGSAFAENDSTTWRWAFFINIPFTGLCFAIALICLPSHMMTPGITLVQRIRQLDPIGIILHIASGTLFAVALTFSGSVWKWGSGPDIAVWVVFGVVFISWGLQQYFCIFTTKDERSLPLHILSRTELVPIWISCLCAGIGYAISLFYTPLFFAFAKGYDAMEQTVRLLPFILPFIACVAITGRILPKIGRYFIIFIVGGAITLAGGAVMANILRVDTPQSHILGIEALIGIGVGMTFQHGIAISNVINKDSRDRVDSLAICNLCQMAGISLMLAVAGSVYQNVGYSLLLDALGEEAKKYSEKDIHEALAGVSSRIWESRDPNVVRSGIQAVATVLAREFYIIAAFGAGSFICGFFMKWERLDFGQEEKAQDDLET
ncbi:major facilitator superfamily domain-containing protein [Mariannaea sp. PMI_226]|nr:major facilitator superfamily domain-containing protein [Mariannaea sp. PMI_226]